MWKLVMAELTKFSRGFGANHRGDQRRKKAKLGRKIDAIDARTDRGGGCWMQWTGRINTNWGRN
jgi:hypothetical protein